MKIAIMQPYLFPYIGYFQLINAADIFIYHDDVQYIKGGWINRNRILDNSGNSKFFTFSVTKAPHTKNINERYFSDLEGNKRKLGNVLQNIYRKAPFFKKAFEIIEQSLHSEETNIAGFITSSNKVIMNYLDINTETILSSNLDKNNNLEAEERVIEICNVSGASHYINPQGGVTLYNKENFHAKGLQLSFLFPAKIDYTQFSNNFASNLSIIDLMMFNSKEVIQEFLEEYTLL